MSDLLTHVSPGTGPTLVGGGVTWDTVHVGVAGVIPAWIRVATYLKTNLNYILNIFKNVKLFVNWFLEFLKNKVDDAEVCMCCKISKFHYDGH
jgi:hypothetical protein